MTSSAGLHAHADALREHARRLLAAGDALVWQGPEADAFRRRVTELAGRCSTAAAHFDRAAGQTAHARAKAGAAQAAPPPGAAAVGAAEAVGADGVQVISSRGV
ncbi:hypothetical protein [Streptomyces bambusae]|uniref:Uncharacterized protein n=1 Tax=Streptomyces bambusae TaxID=1550616 RepID=A0ABS6ZB91_9ACTN|nr:hypothetical protein [Streptomyces bambusae]MBW5484503.1 hypothetical protein [Streptomyces bambusae]